ncbi:sulfatase-like hydrolase/transferase [Shimwellia blattae]|uniref:Putative sulfatase n=1 Tax=Shimwellia blattae (strain ATCC 29907 / DSM 4481 / JCM 1650 / NBRC 105725 / CDC 9005-74) TaxID=630626 RepID=I2B6T3_SHIBC|nr:sulfatase-like hydrolase/transferase [Shimwellia blattae]AFJ46237.1 putative sulfatase [Shimwellia blattae DSM 4481 = NBRC 105725]GAB81125.1 hypothetical protein EB105725_12_00220 [Shimwellia blattae DSM 4481 = NBRC 105725]VDY63704.1 Inner membrane protein yejM [Shimwellia blattae]VEC21841.1 Inner membrane protein yejM [Shimwellia blattae]
MKKLFVFALINVLISALISIRYFLVPGLSVTPAVTLYSALALPGHFFVLYLLLFLICLPFLLLNRYIRNSVFALFFSLSQIVLYIDTIVFEQYRFHINQSVLTLVLSGQVVDFSLATYLLVAAIFFAVFFVELGLLFLVSKYVKPGKKGVVYAVLFAVVALLITNGWYMVAFYYAYSPIMSVREHIPLYYPLTSKKIMTAIDKDGAKKRPVVTGKTDMNVSYPLHPLVINPVTGKAKNIMFLMLDSWRFDTFSREVSPNLYRFVEQQNGISFQNHFSTGNATRTGIFGMYYGIPGTYWDTFLHSSIPSLLVTTMQQEKYEIGVFTSAKVSFPEFDRTVFATVKPLRITSKGDNAWQRDAQMTKDWVEWFKHRDPAQPAFSFLFYDSAHAIDYPPDFPPRFTPSGNLDYMTLNNKTDPQPVFNRYKNSVYYIDSLVQPIFDTLKERGELDNTLIIITSDHAQEMNDNKMGFWGHNGNFTDAQVKVPFIIVGAPQEYRAALEQNARQITSHEDVVPTLMKHYLGVTNPASDYSTGEDLYTPMTPRQWLLMSNYSMWAVKTPDTIYQVNGVGISHYMDKHNQDIPDTPNYKFIYDAMDQMRHFNKR